MIMQKRLNHYFLAFSRLSIWHSGSHFIYLHAQSVRKFNIMLTVDYCLRPVSTQDHGMLCTASTLMTKED